MNREKRAAGHREPHEIGPAAYCLSALVCLGYRIAPHATTRIAAYVALKAQERRLDREREEAHRPTWF